MMTHFKAALGEKRRFAVRWARSAAVWAYILAMAWVPFPLGSAVSWGAGLFEIMMGVCWLLWLAANAADPAVMAPRTAWLYIPLGLFAAVLIWAFVQTLPVFPGLANPVWSMASDALGRRLPGVISIDPWRTRAELLKLMSYGAACWLSYSMAQERNLGLLLFHAVIAIGVIYAIYAFVLSAAGIAQAQIIYQTPLPNQFVSGPFMLHNSFATYAGLAMLAATGLLFAAGSDMIVRGRGARRMALSVLQYVFGTGAFYLVALLLLFAAVAASGSRGGFGAMLAGLAAMAILCMWLARHAASRVWAVAGAILALSPLLVFVLIGNDTLSQRFAQVLDAGTPDDVRLTLWTAARHMIDSAPLQGLGLGTFQQAYPLYAARIMPYVMDKAHCDYLELAAGIGIPAAALLWVALGCMALVCLRGIFARRRDKFFSLTAFCAVVLVAVHSSIDFSLQLPAIGMSFATLLGIGAAQASSSERSPARS